MPLAGEVVRKSYLCPHAARSYHVKLQRQGYTAQRTTDNIYIYITSVDAKHHGASLSERWNVAWVGNNSICTH